jgi:Flp pilus assembly protein TadG
MYALLRPYIIRRLNLARGSAGNAAIEFALVAPILVLLLLNSVDVSFLIWAKMEVENAAQMGAQAAYVKCSPGPLPATTKCGNLNSAITTAIQGTSLGAGVSQASGSPTENYGCPSGTSLTSVGTYSSPPNPFDCSSVGNANDMPGDYVIVGVTYSYVPVFPGLSVISSQTLASSALQRLQ